MTHCESEKKATQQPVDIVAFWALQLSLIEIGLGSFLHAFHVPFSGFFLSLNQCFVLNRALLAPAVTSHTFPIAISNTAAIIKTLSPYGKRFTPMLAISMQGLLFNVGTLLFGKNLLGRCVGSFLLSLWPMFQPLLTYGLIYSSLILSIGDYYHQMMLKLPLLSNVPFQAIVIGYICVHMFLTLGICLMSGLLPVSFLSRYDQYMISQSFLCVKNLSDSRKVTFGQKLWGIGKDFLSPIFFISLVFSALFFYFTLHSLELFFFSFFRIIAIAFVTFLVLRSLPAERCIYFFSKFRFFDKCKPYVEQILDQIQKG